MIYEEVLEKQNKKKEQDKLEQKRDDLLISIVELKKSHRAKIIILNEKIKSLNRMAGKICDANKETVDMYNFKINQLLEDNELLN